MQKYNPRKIELKWQKYWEKKKLFQAKDFSKKKKFYILVEFPYPSGEGLHVGHCRSYTAMDIIARKKRMEGFNVLFPMGWDAFGLPTENFAIKTGMPPQQATRKNTANFKRQLKSLGFSFDWSREINTTDPAYYKWTQWIFIQLFNKGLAYKAKMPINWCLSCKIGLANEEVVEGKCERCGGPVEKREKEQWLLRITKYADRLINDLSLVDYPERVKALQSDWVGRSAGAIIKFSLAGLPFSIDVFTTRPETLFGATYLVLAPEHPLISSLKDKIENFEEIENYLRETRRKTDLQRTELSKEKTGVLLRGIKAINPANKKELPVFVADYILATYGTGAIMAVPAHDQRDWEFAQKYHLEIIPVIEGGEISKRAFREVEKGRMINSGEFNGLRPAECAQKIIRWLEREKKGRPAISYKLRDWVFSRQRYWGEPIPLVFCERCGWVAVPEKDLPVKLPPVKDYKPNDAGESPLAKIKKWVETKCPQCGRLARRETDVMPNWAGSNWYFLRYSDPRQKKKLADEKKLKYWLPVDWYNGGMEHTTLHLLYSRFIYKFLWDNGIVPKELGPEPYRKRTSHGIILGEGGIKMSKSKGNVINPDEVVKEYGADTLRVYEMFMGPFSQAIAWDMQGVKGAQRFLQKIWKLSFRILGTRRSLGKSTAQNFKAGSNKAKLEMLLNQTIKKVSDDIEEMKFNTAIASLMVFANEMEKEDVPPKIFAKFLLVLAPFAPHLAEELWQRLGKKKSIFLEKWPKADGKAVGEEKTILIIQINGRVRDKVEVPKGLPQGEVEKIVLARAKVKEWLGGKEVRKIIFVPDRVINIVL